MKYYQGKYTPKNPAKYDGDPTNIVYRSSWEAKFMRYADLNSSVISWSSEETIIPYISPVDNQYHRYFCDFKLTVRNKENKLQTYLVEIKPQRETIEPKVKTKKTKRYINEVITYAVNQAKWKAASKVADKMGWKFIVLTERELNIH